MTMCFLFFFIQNSDVQEEKNNFLYLFISASGLYA